MPDSMRPQNAINCKINSDSSATKTDQTPDTKNQKSDQKPDQKTPPLVPSQSTAKTTSLTRPPQAKNPWLSEARLRFRFQPQALEQRDKDLIAQLRVMFTTLACVISKECPHNDYLARAVNHLEDGLTAAIRSVSHGR